MAQAAKHPRNAPRILVVEPDPDVRVVLRDLLVVEGLDVQACPALEPGVARNLRIDLVIFGVSRPEAGGLEVLARLRDDAPNTPVIALYGGGGRESASYHACARRLGATRAFAKPFDAAALVRAVRESITPSS